MLIQEELYILEVEVAEITLFEDDVGCSLQNKVDILLGSCHVTLLDNSVILENHLQLQVINQELQLYLLFDVVEKPCVVQAALNE